MLRALDKLVNSEERETLKLLLLLLLGWPLARARSLRSRYELSLSWRGVELSWRGPGQTNQVLHLLRVGLWEPV
jgi:hypothetical protein